MINNINPKIEALFSLEFLRSTESVSHSLIPIICTTTILHKQTSTYFMRFCKRHLFEEATDGATVEFTTTTAVCVIF